MIETLTNHKTPVQNSKIKNPKTKTLDIKNQWEDLELDPDKEEIPTEI